MLTYLPLLVIENCAVNSVQAQPGAVDSRQFAALPEYFVEDISEFMLFDLQ